MKAVLFDAFGRRPDVVDVPDPTPTPHGVVLEVGATGVCRSDWHGWMGHDPDITLPHVPGHELAGTVVALGRDVRNWAIGDRVTVPFVGGCGACPECHAGHQQVCHNQFQPGFTHWGSFAEFVGIHHADLNLVALPNAIAFDTAASLGCRFATAFRGVIDQAKISSGQWIAIHGCGGVGLSAVMIAAASGARVIAVDIDDAKLEFARSLGAEHVINGSRQSVPEAIMDITAGGAHASVDALGHPDTCANSILSLKRRGKHVQIGLLLADQSRPKIPMDRIIGWELEIYGSHGMQAHRYGAMIDLVNSGRLDPAKLVGTRIALGDAPGVLTEMDNFKSTGATVITSFR